MSLRITIVGDGGWGTTLGLVLLDNGHAVTVWGPFPDYILAVRAQRENRLYLPGIALPEALGWTADRREAVAGADVVVLAVPTRFFRAVMDSFAGLIPPTCLVVSVAKGLDQDTHERMTQVAQRALGLASVAALSGPSLADEVARKTPTAVTIASQDPGQAVALQRVFSNRYFRVYTGEDVIGVELGGALKNVIAVAVGVSDGLGLGNNTRAALITRGLAEMSRLGCALGAQPATFAGLSGLGDLIVTCTSRLSRNHTVGERMGKGERIADILAGMKQVAEGVWNCAVARAVAKEHGVEMPLTEEVYALVHADKRPEEAVHALLSRDVKPE